MTHHEKLAVARLLLALHRQDSAATEVELASSIAAVRAAVEGCYPLVRGYEVIWDRLDGARED